MISKPVLARVAGAGHDGAGAPATSVSTVRNSLSVETSWSVRESSIICAAGPWWAIIARSSVTIETSTSSLGLRHCSTHSATVSALEALGTSMYRSLPRR